MARDNYSYQKHRRELIKKKKKEDKLQRKLDKKNEKPAEIALETPSGDTMGTNGQDNKVQQET